MSRLKKSRVNASIKKKTSLLRSANRHLTMQGCPSPSACEDADCRAQRNEGLSVAGKQVRGACRLRSPSPAAPPGTWGDSEPSSVPGTSRRGGRRSVTQAGGGQPCLRVWILSRRRKEGGQGGLVMLTTSRDPSQAASPLPRGHVPLGGHLGAVVGDSRAQPA